MSTFSEPPKTTQSVIPRNGSGNVSASSDALRQKSLTIFIPAVADIEKFLADENHEKEEVATIFRGMSVAAMSAKARARASKQKTRHEIATILATDALSNADNAQWGPFDRTTDSNAEQPSAQLRWLLDQSNLPRA